MLESAKKAPLKPSVSEEATSETIKPLLEGRIRLTKKNNPNSILEYPIHLENSDSVKRLLEMGYELTKSEPKKKEN